MSEIIDGKKMAQEYRSYLKGVIDIDKLEQHSQIGPTLKIVRVGGNTASEIYCRQKKKACKEVGINCLIDVLPEHTQQLYLMNVLRRHSLNPDVDALILQLPLPPHLANHQQEIINCIAPEKDVDCLTDSNYGRLFLRSSKEARFIPCTPLAVKELILLNFEEISGSSIVIIGRSKLVGAPLAKILEDMDATVTLCNSHTPKRVIDILCKSADIIVSAVGNGETIITPDMLIPGRSIVIDIAINRSKDGKLYGDVDYEGCKEVAKAITPVPGGVGPMTVAMLLRNTYYAWNRNKEMRKIANLAF